jgi:hypothetical protein
MPVGSSVTLRVCLTYSPSQYENLNMGTSDNKVTWQVSPWNKTITPGSTGADLCETVVMTNSFPGTARLTVKLQASGLPLFLGPEITWT